jgi:hypothetical protein
MAGRKNLFASLTIVLHACVLRMLRPLRKLGCEFQYPLLNAKLDKLGIKIEFRVGRLPSQKVSLLFKMGLLGAGLYFPALSALNRWLGSPPGGRPSARAATQQRPCPNRSHLCGNAGHRGSRRSDRLSAEDVEVIGAMTLPTQGRLFMPGRLRGCICSGHGVHIIEVAGNRFH